MTGEQKHNFLAVLRAYLTTPANDQCRLALADLFEEEGDLVMAAVLRGTEPPSREAAREAADFRGRMEARLATAKARREAKAQTELFRDNAARLVSDQLIDSIKGLLGLPIKAGNAAGEFTYARQHTRSEGAPAYDVTCGPSNYAFIKFICRHDGIFHAGISGTRLVSIAEAVAIVEEFVEVNLHDKD